MKKAFAVGVSVLAFCIASCFAACSGEQAPPEEPAPLTVTDCFKDFVTTIYFKPSNKPQGFEDKTYSGEHVALSELLKPENDIAADCYSRFAIYTTEKAAAIEVTSISFDVVTQKDCLIQFCLGLSENDILYSDTSITTTAGTPGKITFSSLNKRWTSDTAGKSELRSSGWMIGEASTYLKFEPIGKGTLTDNGYKIQNLKIEFEEL